MRRHLITSALPYINGVKHLGNLIGSMLPADVYARYLRQKGEEVLLLCATDEHGTPAELAARAAGQTVQQYCSEQHEIQKGLAKKWGLSFDHFGRSSSTENKELTQHLARKLKENGYIDERTTQQVFSIADDRFLPDRYVVGTCPHCGYERARGDQCEDCTRVLDPADLISPRSAISGSDQIEIRDSLHLFLLQSKLAEEVRAWVETKSDWPPLARSIALKWLDEGVHDRGITRDLEWGVPVPPEWPGFENKVFYVWFDAPIEYIAAAKELAAIDSSVDWRSWWFDVDEQVEYTEFMAKDNVPFHTVTFPATLLGSREPWKKVDQLKAFNWLTYYGGKFSTSQGRGVFMDAALEVLPVDTWRYFLLANAPESSDSDFTWELVANAVNKDLGGTYGNFVNRLLRFTTSKFGSEVPDGGTPGNAEAELIAELNEAIAEYDANLAELQFRKAMQTLRRIWSIGNVYMDKTAPWKSIKTDADAAALAVRTSFGLATLFAHLSAPVMPEVSTQLLRSLGQSEELIWPKDADSVLQVAAGTKFDVPDLLFARIEDDRVAELETRFGGSDK